jgi:hypothetical protein
VESFGARAVESEEELESEGERGGGGRGFSGAFIGPRGSAGEGWPGQ